MSLILLTGCKTSEPTQEVYVPKLDVSVEKPVLEPIPPLELSGIGEDDANAIADVLATYNRNLVKLVTYSNELLKMQDVIVEYYEEIMKVGL